MSKLNIRDLFPVEGAIHKRITERVSKACSFTTFNESNVARTADKLTVRVILPPGGKTKPTTPQSFDDKALDVRALHPTNPLKLHKFRKPREQRAVGTVPRIDASVGYETSARLAAKPTCLPSATLPLRLRRQL